MPGMLQIRLIEDIAADYPLVASWWRGRNFPEVPQAALPKLGVIVEEDGEPLAAAWLLMSNSNGLAVLVWPTTNPEAPVFRCATALSHAIEFLKQEGAKFGYSHIFSTSAHRGLSSFLSRNGFVPCDRNVTHHLFVNPL